MTEKGTLDSMKNAVLTSKVEGSTTIIFIVPEGSNVEAGDLVCELDASVLSDKETQQQILVVKAGAQMEQANEELEIQKTQNDSDRAAAQLKLDLVKLDLEKFEKGDYLQQVAELQAAVVTAEETLIRTQESCNFIRQLTQKGYKNQNDLESEELVLKRNRFDLDSAKKKLDVLEVFTLKRTLAELEANTKEYDREIDRTKRKGEAALAQKKAEVESCKLTLDVERKKHERLKEQIKACKIYATQDGQVVYANTRDGRATDQVLIEVGATVRERQAIINLPDLDLMKVNARIHESRISLVRTGLPATIKVDAYPDEHFKGEIDSVASVPSSTGGFSRDIKEYEAVVKILDSAEKVNRLRPGLTASVEVLVERRDNVLQVPVQAVVTIGAKQFAFVVEDKSVERKDVTIGQSNDRMIEIMSGLDAGDKIVMNPRSHFKKKIDELELEQAKEQSKASEDAAQQKPKPPAGTSSEAGSKPAGPASKSAKPPAAGSGREGRPPGSPSEGGRPAFDPVARFKELDRNGDGKVTKDEADERMRSRFETFDSDGDGAVSQDEWNAATAKFRGGGGPRPPSGDAGGGS